jgi:hypothetical protein
MSPTVLFDAAAVVAWSVAAFLAGIMLFRKYGRA